MKLSYVIAARNSRPALVKTLDALESGTGLPRHLWEVIVVDNGSHDDTIPVLSHDWKNVKVVCLDEDEGTPARNHGLKRATGRYVCFLNADTHPTGDAIPKALDYLSAHTRVGAVTGQLVSPDGVGQSAALPAVATGGSTVYRTSTLKTLGGFAPECFSQGEEYELSFRLWSTGHKVERFEDIVFGCDAGPQGPRPPQVQKLRLRNLLIVVERYIPRPLRQAYRRDFVRRYAALARADGHPNAMNAALREARVWARREKAVGRKTLSPAAIESIFEVERQAKAVSAWATRLGITRIAVGDLGLNIHATWQACKNARLDVACVAENQWEYSWLDYMGVPVATDDAVPEVQGIVLSTINPALVNKRAAELEQKLKVPVLRLWEPKWIEPPVSSPSEPEGTSGVESRARNVA